jgi:hypothetical protein
VQKIFIILCMCIVVVTAAIAASINDAPQQFNDIPKEQIAQCGACPDVDGHKEVCVVTCGSAHCEASGLSDQLQANGICGGKAFLFSGDRVFELNQLK